MTQYERRLTADLKRIRTLLRDVADRVCRSLDEVIIAIGRNDEDALYEIVINDLSVNRDVRTIDRLCHEFVARHLPAAGHLRFISSVLRIAIALERAGDYSVTISRVVLQLSCPLPETIYERIKYMAGLSRSMLADAMQAFLEGDVKLANAARRQDQSVDRAYDEVFHSLIEHGREWAPMELAGLLRIFTKVERFSDQAKNIGEEAVFAVTGKMKDPKVFRILFVDERNDLASQLAAAVARKMYPRSGVYSSAGWATADELHPALKKVTKRFGIDLERTRPTPVGELDGFPTAYHVVVQLNPPEEAKLAHVPYHTILQKWDLHVPEQSRATVRDSDLDELARELTSRIGSLMERLRGPDAD